MIERVDERTKEGFAKRKKMIERECERDHMSKGERERERERECECERERERVREREYERESK